MLLSFPIYKTMYSMFKENLIKIGVKMNLSIVDWAVFLKKLEDKNFDAFNGAWALGVETDLYQIWHSSQADVPRGSNRIDFRNAQADEIIEKVRITFDQKSVSNYFMNFIKSCMKSNLIRFYLTEREWLAIKVTLKITSRESKDHIHNI